MVKMAPAHRLRRPYRGSLACEAAGDGKQLPSHPYLERNSLQGRKGAESSLRCGPHQPLDSLSATMHVRAETLTLAS